MGIARPPRRVIARACIHSKRISGFVEPHLADLIKSVLSPSSISRGSSFSNAPHSLLVSSIHNPVHSLPPYPPKTTPHHKFDADNREPRRNTQTPMASCNCGLPAAQRTSNTAKNPGRQFYCCSSGRGKGCDFFEWCSGPSPSGGGGGGPGLVSASSPPRSPPDGKGGGEIVDRSKAHNLSDPKYNCVWSVEALDVPGKSAVLAFLQVRQARVAK